MQPLSDKKTLFFDSPKISLNSVFWGRLNGLRWRAAGKPCLKHEKHSLESALLDGIAMRRLSKLGDLHKPTPDETTFFVTCLKNRHFAPDL